MERLTSHGVGTGTRFAASVGLALGLAACSGDGGSPTSPSAPLYGDATTISGVAVAGGGDAVAGQRVGLATPRGGALNTPLDGLQICVIDTDLCVEVGESGTFELAGDISGNIELHITGPGQDVRVGVNDVRTGETIVVSIRLNGDRGTLRVESRRGGNAGPKIEICHRTGNGGYRLIEIDESAWPGHEAHGDGRPGGVAPDDESLRFDEACGLPSVDIEKLTNGEDADVAPGPSVDVGERVTWTYVVTNSGSVTLTNVEVLDDRIASLPCDEPGEVAPGASFECTATGTAAEGPYTNTGTVTADWEMDGEGGSVSDSDVSHYLGETGGDEGDDADDGADRVQLCHLTGNGSYRLIEVSADAVPAHLAHGDEAPVGGSCPDPTEQ